MMSPRFLPLFLGALALLSGALGAQPLTPDLAGAHDLEIKESAPGVFDILTTGADPFFMTRALAAPVDAAETFVLSFEYFCPDGTSSFQVFFGPPISERNSVELGKLGRAEVWQPASVDLKNRSGGKWNGGFKIFRLDPGTKAGVHLQIRHLELREPNAEELAGARRAEEAREKRKAASESAARYIKATFAGKVGAVRVDKDSVRISGQVPEGQAAQYALCELQPFEEPWSMTAFTPLIPLEKATFSFVVPRFASDKTDRLFSRWCLIQRNAAGVFALGSHAVYATAIDEIAERQFAIPKTRTKKGMGGVTYNDIAPELVAVGIEHVTVNVVLNGLLHLAPGKDTSEFAFEGRTYFISAGMRENLDRTMRFYSENGMIISAIVLIGFPADPAERAAFNHPEARPPGIFAMPNLTTADGVRTYRAALAYLAERYSKKENGLVTNWILHNEVDYAWSWTNMGEAPMNIFMDHYVRSMRLAYFTARRFNPRARVFISLTHNWMTPEGAQGKNYVTRDMLDLLVDYTRLEGEFEWGVAYHPYPQSLFEAAAWNDKKATFSFESELITPKNIEVLDAWLHQPRYLYQGKTLRGVMLSEQGFHTRDYSDAAQKLQAAALIYTWHKIRPLETIECFQNHRWIDALGEGGLLLGLRTLASPGKPFGDKKLALSVFEALDTPREAEATAFAKEIIGIQDFSEIPYRGPIK